MDPMKVATKDGKAFGTNAIQVESGYTVHPAYDLLLLEHGEIGTTGLLKIFELVPREEGFPRFIGRWDEKADHLDVDIIGSTEEVSQQFRRGQSGYQGHHPAHLPERRFIVDVRASDLRIFHGVVSFGLRRELALELKVTGTLSVSAEAIRGGKVSDA